MGSNNKINDRTGKRESWLTRAEYRIENDRGKRRTQCRKVVPKSVLVFGVPAEVLRVVIAQAEEWKVGGRKFGDCPFDCTPLKTRNRIMSAMMVNRNEQDRARKEMELISAQTTCLESSRSGRRREMTGSPLKEFVTRRAVPALAEETGLKKEV